MDTVCSRGSQSSQCDGEADITYMVTKVHILVCTQVKSLENE